MTYQTLQKWPKIPVTEKKTKVSGWDLSRSCMGKMIDFTLKTRCLKITEKVSFNIASNASYVYILSGQKLNEKSKQGRPPRKSEKGAVRCG